MLRLIALLAGAFALAAGLDWLAARPGTITIDWLGHRAEPTVFQAVVGLVLVAFGGFYYALFLRAYVPAPPAAGIQSTRSSYSSTRARPSGIRSDLRGCKRTVSRHTSRCTRPKYSCTRRPMRARCAQPSRPRARNSAASPASRPSRC